MICDVNGDGRIEYSEFAPMGADVIHTMRMRQQAAAQTSALELKATYLCLTLLFSMEVVYYQLLRGQQFKLF